MVTFPVTKEQQEYLRKVASEDFRTVSSLMRVFIQDCLPEYRESLKAKRDKFAEATR